VAGLERRFQVQMILSPTFPFYRTRSPFVTPPPCLPHIEEDTPPDTLELVLPAEQGRHARLIATLELLGFERFWQEDECLRAYVPAARWGDRAQARLEKRLAALGQEEVAGPWPVTAKNWNAVWEERLAPVRAGPFVIAPPGTEAPPDCDPHQVLRIDPQMSFGTGHHESTRLALHLLARPAPSNGRVLDAGTGTGVLALAAVRLGAARVVAFDADARVLENARENLARNGATARVDLRAGPLAEAAPDEDGFALILANINRSALLDLLPAFRKKLAPGGHVILSGLLKSDRAALRECAAAQGLAPQQEATEGDWWAARLGEREEGEPRRASGSLARPS
jgi:ribosomal protein L11 methyltransferase